MSHPGLPTSTFALLLAALFGCLPCNAQIVTKTNTLASYSYNSTSGFTPDEPLASASESISTFSFFPTSFSAATSGSLASTNTRNGSVILDLVAKPTLHFAAGVSSMNLNAKLNYSLAAPTSTSVAYAGFLVPFTLEITGINGVAFIPSGAPYAASLAISPASASVSGPVGFSDGSLSGSVALDLNTVKTHFGIPLTDKVTALRLNVTPSILVHSAMGSSSASLVNFDVVNQVVPEPSTYALLLFCAGVAGLGLWQRRKS